LYFEVYLDSKVGNEIESYEKIDFSYLINYFDNQISDSVDFEEEIIKWMNVELGDLTESSWLGD
jgi:hypothetical protein